MAKCAWRLIKKAVSFIHQPFTVENDNSCLKCFQYYNVFRRCFFSRKLVEKQTYWFGYYGHAKMKLISCATASKTVLYLLKSQIEISLMAQTGAWVLNWLSSTLYRLIRKNKRRINHLQIMAYHLTEMREEDGGPHAPP